MKYVRINRRGAVESSYGDRKPFATLPNAWGQGLGLRWPTEVKVFKLVPVKRPSKKQLIKWGIILP